MARLINWVDRAACVGYDPELWFPMDKSFVEMREPILVCNSCPVIQDCYKFAVTTRQHYGIWGGVLFTSKRIVSPRAS